MKIDKKTIVGLVLIVVLLIIILFMIYNNKTKEGVENQDKKEKSEDKDKKENSEDKEIKTEKEITEEIKNTINNISNKDIKEFITDDNKSKFPSIYKLCQAVKSYKEDLVKIKQNTKND